MQFYGRILTHGKLCVDVIISSSTRFQQERNHAEDGRQRLEKSVFAFVL